MADPGFRYLDHVTDLIIEASGSTLENAFVNSALGLVNAMFEITNVSLTNELLIEATGHDIYSVLYNWLEQVLLLMLVDKMIVSEFEAKISEIQGRFSIKGIAKGEKVDMDKHRFKIEIKGVTYHEMEIKRYSTGIIIRYMLDL